MYELFEAESQWMPRGIGSVLHLPTLFSKDVQIYQSRLSIVHYSYIFYWVYDGIVLQIARDNIFNSQCNYTYYNKVVCTSGICIIVGSGVGDTFLRQHANSFTVLRYGIRERYLEEQLFKAYFDDEQSMDEDYANRAFVRTT